MMDPAATSSGGLVSPIRKGVARNPIRLISRPLARVSSSVFPTVRLRSCRSWAPKYWALRIPAPVAMPMNRTSSRFRIGPAVPTAASAVSPIYWPTMMESTVLYSCWAKLPISSGIEKRARTVSGRPTVISCVPKRDLMLLMFRLLAVKEVLAF